MKGSTWLSKMLTDGEAILIPNQNKALCGFQSNPCLRAVYDIPLLDLDTEDIKILQKRYKEDGPVFVTLVSPNCIVAEEHVGEFVYPTKSKRV